MLEKPKVTIVIPTLNSARTLAKCLASINNQVYLGKVEIIITDGGSNDDTLEIAQRYGVKIYRNKLVTGEAGKALGYKKASGEIIGFIDSDNVLVTNSWLKMIVKPFLDDQEIVASEPISFEYRKKDDWLTRYFALLGMGDPVNLFTGLYDKYSWITDRWTGLNIKTKDEGSYLTFFIEKEIPTIGANGFFIKKEELNKYPIKDYLFDIDVLKFLCERGKVKIAKVKIGIIHLFSGNISAFARKQRRRIRDFLYFNKKGLRYFHNNQLKTFYGLIKFILATIFILPSLIQALTGYKRKKDWVWFFHPVACWLTLIVYGVETVKLPFTKGILNRKDWKQ